MKKTYILIIAFVFILSAVSAIAQETTSNIVVSRALICRDIQDREPIDVGISFPQNIGKIYFFTEIKANETGKVKHIWYYKNKRINEIELDFRPTRFRTWSAIYIRPDQKGDWSVEIVYDTKVLNRLAFKIE